MCRTWHSGAIRRVPVRLHEVSSGRAAVLLALAIFLVPAQVADTAQIQIGFRPQNGSADTATEWALEMISDTPIGSTGIYILNADPYTGFTSGLTTPVGGLPGVQATIHAIEDPAAPWGLFNATFEFLPAGIVLNMGPGFLATDLGPVDTWLGLGVLHGVTGGNIMAGEGVETNLWADAVGTRIPASDVAFTFPEPGALMLIGLGLCALALLRYSAA
jgi:hypothetical protein